LFCVKIFALFNCPARHGRGIIFPFRFAFSFFLCIFRVYAYGLRKKDFSGDYFMEHWLDKKKMSEEDIKLNYITPAISEKWGFSKITMETNVAKLNVAFTDGKISLKGNIAVRDTPKKADYVLYLRPHYPIAIVEAKENKYSVSHGIQQAKEYAKTLDVPFAFSSNGDAFCEYDFLTGKEQQFPNQLELQ